MTLNQLKYFQILARTEHYHRAADLLFISQPSLSRAMAQLESELGVRLFEKQGRNVLLTEAGGKFLRYVDSILNQIDQAVEEVKNFPSTAENISIGCILPALMPYVSPMLKSYQENTPVTHQYQTISGVSEDLLAELLSGAFDVVFCSYVENMKKVQFIPVCKLPFYVVVRRDSPFAARPGIRPAELNHSRMLFTRHSAYSQMIKSMLASYQVEPVVSGLSNDEPGLLGLVEAGLGLFITTDYPQIRSENTVLVPLVQKRFHRYIYMATCIGREYSPAVQRLIDFNRRIALPHYRPE